MIRFISGRTARSVAAGVMLGLLTSCAMFGGGKKNALVKGGAFFTKVNMWYSRKGEITSTNYHLGEMLPAGTRVTIISCRGTKVKFETEGGDKYTLVHSKRHSRLSLAELFDRHFAKSDVTSSMGIYSDFSPREQTSVESGTIGVGMSRDAVLMAYGYPPSHRTPDLRSDTWTYWVGRQVATVRFKDDTVSNIEGLSTMRLVKIYVVSDPPGAMIQEDGKFVGKAPCTVDLEIKPGAISRKKVFRATPAKLEAPRLGVLCDAPFASETVAGDPITVREVIPLSSGHRLGLVPGDKILSVNGERISNEFECMNAIRRTGFGRPLRMSILRGGREMSLLGRTDVQETGTFYPKEREYAVSTLAEMDGKVMFFDLRGRVSRDAPPAAVTAVRQQPPVAASTTAVTEPPPPVVPDIPDLPLVASGFLVTGQGHIITSASWLKEVKKIVVRSAAGKKYVATVVHTDQVNDWCLLKAAGLRGTPLAVSGGGVKTGDRVFRLGYPVGGGKGLDVASGRIASPKGFGGDPRHVQVKIDGDAKNLSGAPVVNAQGEWLGVVSDRLDRIIHAFAGAAATDVNFLLKAKTVSDRLPRGVALPTAVGGSTTFDKASAKKRLSRSVVAIHAK